MRLFGVDFWAVSGDVTLFLLAELLGMLEIILSVTVFPIILRIFGEISMEKRFILQKKPQKQKQLKILTFHDGTAVIRVLW